MLGRNLSEISGEADGRLTFIRDRFHSHLLCPSPRAVVSTRAFVRRRGIKSILSPGVSIQGGHSSPQG